MVTQVHTLPVSVLRRIETFIELAKTGQITLEVKAGRVLKVSTSEHWQVNEAYEGVDKGR